GSPDRPANGVKVVKAREREELRVLRPNEVPAELARVKSKADIKAEVEIRTSLGRPIVFPGVIRNGKLIEILVDGKFVVRPDLEQSQVGLRLWWSKDSDGYIFFRYSIIKTITLRGEFTAEERRALFKRLAAKRRDAEGAEKEAAAEPEKPDWLAQLEKMTPARRKATLIRRYPYDKGWTHERYRELTRKRILDNKPLSPEEEVFLQYFTSILAPARFEELGKPRKIEIEPGSAHDAPESGSEPAGEDGVEPSAGEE
ncbi:MAG: hypothetical protein ACE5JG_01470, partial [Planctomycetota bacterium]